MLELLILSKFYPDFILNLPWFCPDYIQILSRWNQNKRIKRTWTGLIGSMPIRFLFLNIYNLDTYFLIWLDFSLFFSRLSRNWLTSSTFSLVRTKAMRITNTCSAQCKWKKTHFLSKECEQGTMRHTLFWAKLIVTYYLKP